MAISNLTTGIRTGVCTSTTRPTTPYEGQMIYETDTNRVLVYEGAAWVMIADTDTPPGIDFIKSVTVGSGVTTVPISDVFNSTYANYLVIASGINSNVDGYGLKIKLNNSTGATYNALGNWMSWNSATINAIRETSDVSNGAFVGFSSTNSATNFTCTIINPFASAYTTFVFSGAGTTYACMGNSIDKNATSSTSFTLNSYDGATMTGGTIRVYGYRNSI